MKYPNRDNEKREQAMEMRIKQIKESEPLRLYKQAAKTYSELNKSHRRCAGCGLCFGGHHIAKPAATYKELGEVCQWCKKTIDKIGIKKFKESIKPNAE